MAVENLDQMQQLYHEKTEYLKVNCEEVDAFDFYRDVFPVGSFEQEGDYDAGLPNGIVLEIKEKDKEPGKRYPLNHLLFDDLELIEDLAGCPFAITSPVSYFGKNRTAENSRYLYAFAIDLDGVGMPQLRDTFHQMRSGWAPTANYVVNSGTGLHLYYLLETPIPMYPKHRKALKELKHALIDRVWNDATSTLEKKQWQGVVQGYRVVGTQSKLGEGYPVRAYHHGEKRWTFDELLQFVANEKKREQIRSLLHVSGMSLEQAKKKYPEWYDKRVVRKEPPGRWYVKRDLYDWWLRRIREEATVHHRYWCIACLAIYAKKCEGAVGEDELVRDAFSLLDYFESLTDEETNHFTESDIADALELYNEELEDTYNTRVRRETIEYWSGIKIPKNKRNFRKQSVHLARARVVQSFDDPEGNWRNKDGRPKGSGTKEQQIKAFAAEHPEMSNRKIAEALGVSRNTVNKWLKSEGSQPDRTGDA